MILLPIDSAPLTSLSIASLAGAALGGESSPRARAAGSLMKILWNDLTFLHRFYVTLPRLSIVHAAHGSAPMMDLLWVGAVFVAFAATLLLVVGCARLQARK
jgi:hypothetical protein